MRFRGFSLSRIFIPPSLLLRQFGSLLLYRHLAGWKRLGYWLAKNSLSTIPISAGARGMGCIGYPAHPVWEVTSRCNLKCLHCHVSAQNAQGAEELTTHQARSVIDQLRLVKEFRSLVYTGGEPMVREDIFSLLDHSYKKGFVNIIATNATLIDKKKAKELCRCGVAAAAVSLDSACEKKHNHIRGSDQAFSKAQQGIEALRSAGVAVQINITAMGYNIGELEELLDRVQSLNAVIVLLYQLVPVGRANDISAQTLDARQNRDLARFIKDKQRDFSGIIEPVALPQFWPYLLKEKKWGKPGLRLAEKVFHGCCAGRGFVYIKSNGDIWPCPFIEQSAGNMKDNNFLHVWKNSPLFRTLRSRETLLKGKCGSCEYRGLCGGCRGRAAALTGDLMAEDPTCFF